MVNSLFDITGKKAIVTGGTRGLGKGMAEGLMESGAEVAIIGTSDKVYQVADEFKARGFVCYGVKADLSDRDQCNEAFNKCVELLGDLDILVPAHGVYWPAMLHAMGFSDEEMPTLLVHGWWNINGEKMSKSIGNVVDPNLLAEQFGPEPVRYYLVRDITTGKDANFDADRLVMLYNTELANDLGNLCNRSINMTRRYCDSVISGSEAYDDEASKALRATMDQAVTLFSKYMDDNMASDALAALNAQVSSCNAYIEQQQPCQLAKDEASAPRLRCVLRHLLECCAQTGYLIGCVLPDASARILGQLNAGDLFRGLTPAALEWGVLPAGHRINDPAPVFPRILSEEEKAKLAEKAARAAKKQG